MKQIKTILERKPEDFDDKVNEALRDGWRMKWSKITSDLIGAIFIARMEMEPGTCDDCRHKGNLRTDEPCNECGADCDKWEAEVQAEDQK